MNSIVRLEDRAVLRVAGADARDFLQGMLTNDVAVLASDRPLFAGLLSPQGKALFDMFLFDSGDGAVLIDVDATRVEALARRLTMYRMRKAVTIAPVPAAVIAGWNGGEAGHACDPRLGALGGRWIEPATSVPPGADAYDAHRLGVGVPGSADIGSDDLLWLETGADLLNGVSFTKGCYVGQENTARMHHRDKVRRRLVPVSLGTDPGDGAVFDAAITDGGGRSAGRLRSRRGMHGIAHLRLEASAAPLLLGDIPIAVARPPWLEPSLVAAVQSD
jgi:folate-binding protein YgfZ